VLPDRVGRYFAHSKICNLEEKDSIARKNAKCKQGCKEKKQL
jgi:hypothetical protein